MVGFAADGVNFASDFLTNKAEFFSLSGLTIKHFQKEYTMSLKSNQLFGDVEFFQIINQLLFVAVFIKVALFYLLQCFGEFFAHTSRAVVGQCNDFLF